MFVGKGPVQSGRLPISCCIGAVTCGHRPVVGRQGTALRIEAIVVVGICPVGRVLVPVEAAPAAVDGGLSTVPPVCGAVAGRPCRGGRAGLRGAVPSLCGLLAAFAAAQPVGSLGCPFRRALVSLSCAPVTFDCRLVAAVSAQVPRLRGFPLLTADPAQLAGPLFARGYAWHLSTTRENACLIRLANRGPGRALPRV